MNAFLFGSSFSFSLALWQSPVVSQLQAKSRSANWPLLIGVGVLLLAVFFILKQLPKLLGRKRSKVVQFPGDEDSFRAVFDEAATGVGLLDKSEKLIFANRALEKMLGYTGDELKGGPLSNFAHPEDAHSDKDFFNELKQGDRPKYIVERRFYHKDGRMLWLRQQVLARASVMAHLQRDAAGAVGAVLLEDITRSKNAEAELLVTREAIHNLYEVIVDRQLDLLEKMTALLAMGCRRFNVDTGVLGQIVDGGFEVLQVVSPDERIRRNKFYERSTQISDAHEPTTARHTRLRQNNGNGGGDFAHDWRNFPFYSVADVEVFLSAPINVLGRNFGVLCFSSLSAREEPFSPGDREFLQLMAQWLGGELERLQALAELETKQQALMAANTQLEALATIDGLTGAKNRRAFDEQLEMEFRRALRYSTPLSLMLLDVDKFKQYNDSQGHLAGDEVLKIVARELNKNVRVIDFVARYGGEEFVVLLPNTDAEGAMILAERLRIKIENAPWPKQGVTASFGVASISKEMKERAELTGEADRALYASKDAGRNRCIHVNDVA